ncbi:NADPH-dependent FMN reductase [Tritrichomonas foetus]|uniref:NADPH-dependent FMN reductase n=1 Tax=Tritrichomonas foetus TaxID=1144522 RepID=A0A1J4KMR2_9EUKA|nr:NADPH-dependent FMN reductase [Tritrichomonas foetus]|eukprot:OHT12607.1 NADPH-dependent FMN reductase [Tritrichomonas foetus]
MSVIGINGSPRPNWNTAKLLAKALEGAASNGFQTELINLNKIKFSPCSSCLVCKKTRETEGRCHQVDELTPILEKLKKADAIIFASPTYFGQMSGLFHTFFERAIFPLVSYRDFQSVLGRKIKTGMIFNCGADQQEAKEYGYDKFWEKTANEISSAFNEKCELLTVCDTMEVQDYSKYQMQCYDAPAKEKHRDEEFPKELQAAYELGKKITTK